LAKILSFLEDFQGASINGVSIVKPSAAAFTFFSRSENHLESEHGQALAFFPNIVEGQFFLEKAYFLTIN